MSPAQLRVVRPGDVNLCQSSPVDIDALAVAGEIIEDVRQRGESAVREHAERFGDILPGAPLVLERPALAQALEQIAPEDRSTLERTAARIEAFAKRQKACLLPLDMDIEGGRAGHRWLPVQTAGAYAPGGRYPLPSSLLMTCLPARVAGVKSIWAASPRPAVITQAAAALGGVDGVLAIGGAQAIAALAFGLFSPPCDIVVGPGNRFVTAAKKYLVGEVGIDSLAGPSELLVIADGEANPDLIAADLIAQAEHDVDAIPILLTPCRDLIDRVNQAIGAQLQTLPTAETAAEAIERSGLAIWVQDLNEAAQVSNRLAPEHLELMVQDLQRLRPLVQNYGGLFLGAQSAEVLGDYGAGPNHVLPTGRTARYQAGLSVATFLRASTFLEMDDARAVARDATRLARLEGLEGHARAAAMRSDL